MSNRVNLIQIAFNNERNPFLLKTSAPKQAVGAQTPRIPPLRATASRMTTRSASKSISWRSSSKSWSKSQKRAQMLQFDWLKQSIKTMICPLYKHPRYDLDVVLLAVQR